jgi:Ni/Co efflux regulator RcnB
MMKKIVTAIVCGLLFTTPVMSLADPDDRQDRRQERGRSDERHDRRDCRQDEGMVGQDKRECKQEEVRDGVRGNQGERFDGDDDDKDD